MIFRLLTKFNQKPGKKQYIKDIKLLTINILSVYKDQLIKKPININLLTGFFYPERTKAAISKETFSRLMGQI